MEGWENIKKIKRKRVIRVIMVIMVIMDIIVIRVYYCGILVILSNEATDRLWSMYKVIYEVITGLS